MLLGYEIDEQRCYDGWHNPFRKAALHNKQRQKRITIAPQPAGQRIGIAVSGGADSVALLHLLLELEPKTGFIPCVIHVNHMLRGRSSDADEKFVAQLAKTNHLEFLVKKIDVASITKRQNANLEDVARRERYAFFESLVRERRVDRIAVAHTADDQAETVLGHILRGTGLAGLRGIHPETDVVFRPLLTRRRAELRDYLRSIGQRWREDATNQDTRRTRARIRYKLLPMLEREFSPAAVPHLCQLAELARKDEAYMDRQAAIHEGHILRKHGTEVRVDVADLLRLDVAIESRVLRRAIDRVKPRAGQTAHAHIAAALELARQPDGGKSLPLPGGVELLRECAQLRLRAKIGKSPAGQSGDYAYPIDLTRGSVVLPVVELSCALHFRVIDWPLEGRETIVTGAVLDRNRLGGPLVVRNWRPGDAMRPLGHQKTHTLARLLNEKSVSRWEKASWPVLTCAERPVWVRGLLAASEFAAGPETRMAVVVTEEPDT